jgi:F-type H+-transporting ATPase subunit c
MRKFTFLFIVVAILFVAAPLYAQTPGGSDAAAAATAWAVPLAAGIGMGIASGLCGIGQGKATASATEALARNPCARAGIQLFLILGLALIESLALYALVIILVKAK